jgi:hypothetical protein
MMISTFIFASLIGAISAMFILYFKNSSFSFEEQQAVGTVEQTMTRMVRDIREARQGDDGGWPIISAADNELIFFSDVTNDGRADRVRYFIQGTELIRGVIEPTTVPVSYPQANEKIQIIMSNVSLGGKPLFTYYNGYYPVLPTGNPIPTGSRLLNTRLVTIYLRIDLTPNFSSLPFEASASVHIRSMKDNL